MSRIRSIEYQPAFAPPIDLETAGVPDRSSKAYIRWVQESLNKITAAGLVVDGVSGSKTKAAVKTFQASRGLTVDGIVGAQTEQALIAAGATAPPLGSGGGTTTTPSVGPYPQVNTALPDYGPGFYAYQKSSSRRFGIPETIRALGVIGVRWLLSHLAGPRMGIGDISRPGGGSFPPHKSHQKGVDIDIRPMRNDGVEGITNYLSSTYSRELTQELVDIIRSNGILSVKSIYFNDPFVEGVSHEPGHDNHLHVRFIAPGPSGELDFEEQEISRSSSEYVRWVQQSLNRIMQAKLAEDGRMGPQTQAAVRKFQSTRGLTADGKVGPITEQALITAGAASPPHAGAAPRPRREPVKPLCAPPAQLSRAERTALSITTTFETGVAFGCAVSAVDGISFGMLQWNLLAGTMQQLLAKVDAQGRLTEFFGPDTDRVRQMIRASTDRAGRLEVVAQAKAEGLAERWRPVILRLCADSQFCRMLGDDILARMRSARSAARQLELQTTRGLTMMFDINNGDGLGQAKLRFFREQTLGRGLAEKQKLVIIANAAANRVGEKLREERRARRLLIANGSGMYRRSQWNLDRDFPGLDEPWEAPATSPEISWLAESGDAGEMGWLGETDWKSINYDEWIGGI